MQPATHAGKGQKRLVLDMAAVGDTERTPPAATGPSPDTPMIGITAMQRITQRKNAQRGNVR